MAVRSSHVEEPQRDEDEDGGQGRQRHVPQHAGDRDEQHHHDGRAERAGLGASPGRGDGAGARRAGVDRERTREAGHDAAGADGEEVAAGVDVVAALLGEGAAWWPPSG